MARNEGSTGPKGLCRYPMQTAAVVFANQPRPPPLFGRHVIELSLSLSLSHTHAHTLPIFGRHVIVRSDLNQDQIFVSTYMSEREQTREVLFLSVSPPSLSLCLGTRADERGSLPFCFFPLSLFLSFSLSLPRHAGRRERFFPSVGT